MFAKLKKCLKLVSMWKDGLFINICLVHQLSLETLICFRGTVNSEKMEHKKWYNFANTSLTDEVVKGVNR